jgi:ubiquinone/menaquinone biosynthesis C-methylase UbiE
MASIDELKENWNDASAYDAYVGRWSRLISLDFIKWINPDKKLKWMEIGCGTGALTKIIADECDPTYLLVLIIHQNILLKPNNKFNILILPF